MRAIFCLLLFGVVLGCGSSSSPLPPKAPPDPLRSIAAVELFERGVELARDGDLIRAEQYLTASLRRGYPEDRVVPMLVTVCLAGSRVRAALSYAAPYLDRHPDDAALRQLVATLHLALGNLDRAQAEIEEVLRQHPARASAHYVLGVLLRDERHDLRAAQPHFSRYVELEPNGTHAVEARMWSKLRVVHAEAPEESRDLEVAPAHGSEGGAS